MGPQQTLQLIVMVSSMVAMGMLVWCFMAIPKTRHYSAPVFMVTGHILFYYVYLFLSKHIWHASFVDAMIWSTIIRLHTVLTVIAIAATMLHSNKRER